MLGDFITRCLLLVLGYAYPAFECYKTVERNMVGIEELRFWCQYWIIIAILTVVERFADIFVSWLPMYAEMKLAFVIYLWYPKTKGTGYVYDALLRPYVAKHETDIDKKLVEWRVRLWDLAIFYWNNCTEMGQSAFFTVLQYLSSQSARFASSSDKKNYQGGPGVPPLPPTVSSALREHMNMQANEQSNKNKWSPSPSAPPVPNGDIYRNVYGTSESDVVRAQLDSNTESAYFEKSSISDEPSFRNEVTSTDFSEDHQKGLLHHARVRFKRYMPSY